MTGRSGRVYAVGDIHGCQDKLARLLQFLDTRHIGSDETVVFLGDYIDRGPGTRNVLEALLRWKEAHPRTIFLRGNHEQMLLDARDDWLRLGEDAPYISTAFDRWWFNGGSRTADSYGATSAECMEAIPEPHWAFIRRTQFEYWEGGYHFVHAGLVPDGFTWDEPQYDPRLWIRRHFLTSRQDFGGKVVVFGHTPQLEDEGYRPFIRGNKIGLDTAAALGVFCPSRS